MKQNIICPDCGREIEQDDSDVKASGEIVRWGTCPLDGEVYVLES